MRTWKDQKLLAKVMLSKLGDRTIQAHDWEKLCYQSFNVQIDFGHDRFRRMLNELLEDGYIERVERGIYRVTENGKEQLELWKKQMEE